MLGTALHFRLEARFLQLGLQQLDDVADELRPVLLRLRDLLLGVGVLRLLEVPERQVFQLNLDPLDAEPVGERRVDVERLLGDALLALGLHVLERAHVVGAVGQLHQDDPDVLGHRHQHLAEVLGLLFLLGRRAVREGAQLGDPLDEGQHLRPEQLVDLLGLGEGVLDGVVEQTGDDAGLVQLQLGQEAGDFQRVDEVGLARFPDLTLVDLGAVDVGLFDQVQIGFRPVGIDPLEDVVEPDHRLKNRA